MSGHRWPNSGRYHHTAIDDHLASLKADPDNDYLHNTTETGSSRVSRLPSSFREKAAKGISSGVAEAQSNGHCSQMSEADKDSFINTMLDSITTATAAGAQDAIPLAQIRGLRDSNQDRLDDTAAHSRLNGAREEAKPNGAIVNGVRINEIISYSATVIIYIRHQASVNRMGGRDDLDLGEAISVTLESFFFKDWFRGSMRLSAAEMLDCGDVQVVGRAEYRADLERLIQATAWHEEFERRLGPPPIQTYNVRMHSMRFGCMTFNSRREKSVVIKTLADANFPIDPNHNIRRTIINDIHWCMKSSPKKKEKRTCALMIEFLCPEQANKAIGNGLLWQGTHHACNIADQFPSAHQRCDICQKYGHPSQTCSAEPRCEFCPGQHLSKDCAITKMECVLCGRPHPCVGRGSQFWEQGKKRCFPTFAHLPRTDEPVSETHQNVIKMEPDRIEPTFDGIRDGYPIAGTLPAETDDFRTSQIPKDTGFHAHAPVIQKREADDAFPEAQASEHTKRIKQEDVEQEILTQEDLKQEDRSDREESMAPWRQPSPFIVGRLS